MSLIITETSITALLCSLRAFFTTHFDYERPRLPNIWTCHDLVCYKNEKETHKTYLTNHKGTITRHYLLILSLGGGHTNTHTVLRFYTWLAGELEHGITIPSTSAWFITYIAVCL